MEIIDVIVVGGGHAGLAASYYLCKNDLSHIVFERGKIGESWRSQRWKNFKINTPNCINILPVNHTMTSDPDAFMTGNEYVDYLVEYANKHKLPVNENSKVVLIESEGERFSVIIKDNMHVQHYLSKQVIIASGAMSSSRIPGLAKALPENIFQIHAAEYKDASQLPNGGVLVVGGAQSGCQIAEDLAENNRDVYLASSKVMRIPRRYRGKDITFWLTTTKFFDVTTDSVTDPKVLIAPPAQVSGTGKMGHTVSYQYLKSLGVKIMGHLNLIENDQFIFGPDAKANVKFSDDGSEMVKRFIDDYISKNGLYLDPNEPDPADIYDVDSACAENVCCLNYKEKNITSVVWCTGFTGDFSYLKLPVLTPLGMPVHRNGISPVKGLYFLGFPWLRSRKSGVIYGISEDAEAITNHVVEHAAGITNTTR